MSEVRGEVSFSCKQDYTDDEYFLDIRFQFYKSTIKIFNFIDKTYKNVILSHHIDYRNVFKNKKYLMNINSYKRAYLQQV